MENKKNRYIILTLICFLLSFVSQEAFAGFTVTPMLYSLDIPPGNSKTQAIKVHNGGKTPLSIKAYLGDFIRDQYGKEKKLGAGSHKRSCARWIEISPLEFKLPPGETKTVRFTMTIPEDAAGAYWTNIFFSQVVKPKPRVPEKGKSIFQISVALKYRIRVLENVPGTLKKMGRIVDMITKPYEQDDSLIVDVVFENTGNSILHPGGKVEIKNENGETVKTLSLINKGDPPFQVYPGSKRIVHARTKEKLPPGSYIALAIIDYGDEDLVAGEMEFEVK